MMKNIKFLVLIFSCFLAFLSCEEDDSITFIAQPVGEFEFTNTPLSLYTLTSETSNNIGERFTWNSANFDAPTNINYELHKSIIGDFSDAELISSTTENEITVTIGDLLDYAEEAGLDNDPDTTEMPDTGTVSFRIRATVGTDSSIDMYSNTQELTLYLPEEAPAEGPNCEYDQLWGVGAGLPDAGWGWDSPVQIPCVGNGVYAANVNLQNLGGSNGDVAQNNFRFFTVETDWASGQNYPYYADDDYTIDANLVNAEDGDSNFAFTGTTGTYYLEIDTENKTITLGDPQFPCEFDQLWLVGAGVPDAGWGWDTPVQLPCTGEGIYSGMVNFQNLGGSEPNNNFRFFTVETDWGSGLNYPYYEGEGYTIDSNFENAEDGDSNFAFIGTTGSYLLTVDTVNLTITLE